MEIVQCISLSSPAAKSDYTQGSGHGGEEEV
jgi:hypothetical protein